jgi:class 3 adenylate cyclase
MVMVERALCPVLVGRGEELSVLEDALLAANRGQGSVVALAGDAGLGKTRLATELEHRARAVGAEVLSGGCSEADLSLPYLPLLEAIGNYLAGADIDAVRARLGQAARELAQLFPQLGRGDAASQDVESAQAKLRLFEAMIALLRVPADDHGLLLVIEDLHWADASTREMLDYMTRRLRQTRIIVLATYRRDEMHRKHPLAPIVQGWRRSGSATVIELEPLDHVQLASMVRAIFDVNEVTEEFVDFLHERCEGNPFVLEEMLKEAIDRGDLYRSETGEWERKDLAQLAIPRSVADSILARVERMDPDHADVLRAAAVLGPQFEYQILREMTGLPEDVVQTALAACVQQQLIVAADRPGVYRFRHALTREAVYEDMILPRRQQLHARAAEILETLPDARPVAIANHLFAAGQNEAAVPLALRAADEAMSLAAYPEASAIYERVLEQLSDQATRARVLATLANAYLSHSEAGRARPYAEEAVRVYGSIGDRLGEARARLWLGRAAWEQSDGARAQHEYELAREILEGEGPSEDLANTYVRLASMGVFNFRNEEAKVLALKAISIAEAAGADQPRVWVYNFLGCALAYEGLVEEGLGYLERSYREAMERGWTFIASNALHNILAGGSEIYLMAKKMPEVLDRLQALPITVWPEGVPFRVAFNQYALGRVDEAVRINQQVIERTRAAGVSTVAQWAEANLGAALTEAGRLEEARAYVHQIDPDMERQEMALDARGAMDFFIAVGEYDKAADVARIVRDSGGWHRRVRYLLSSCVEALIGVGALEEAAEMASEDGLAHEPSERPHQNKMEGMVALARGDAAHARDVLSRAAEAFDEAGHRLYEMRARLQLAEALIELGENDEARDQLETVIKHGLEGGARLRITQAQALAEQHGLTLTAVPEEQTEILAADADLIETGERLVTILFADVRGYTAMTNERAPADMVDRIGSFHRWAQQEIDKRGGLVDKFAGDAVMATFNVSGRAIDHAERALEAGMALQDKAALMGLPVGVGIAVGAAIVGRFAEGANVSVLGETTNLAARLQANAGAQEVALSEEAYRRTKGFLEKRGLAADQVGVELKGFDQPVTAYIVRRAR